MQKNNQQQIQNWMRKKLHPLVVLIVILFLGLLTAFITLIKLPISTNSSDNAPLVNLPPIQYRLTNGQVDLLNKPVIDLSGWQAPKNINYDELSSEVSGAIVRVQHGNLQIADNAVKANGEDTAFKTHMTSFQKRGIPVAVYAYVNGSSIQAMKEEAKSFYARAQAYDPTFWWLDIETDSMEDLNAGVQAFREELASLGIKNVGIYSQVWFLTSHNIDTTAFAATWLAAYGSDKGDFEGKPETTLDYSLHQYTSKGRLNGYSGYLDLSRVSSQNDYDKIFLRK